MASDIPFDVKQTFYAAVKQLVMADDGIQKRVADAALPLGFLVGGKSRIQLPEALLEEFGQLIQPPNSLTVGEAKARAERIFNFYSELLRRSI
jgi:hypothetical protein